MAAKGPVLVVEGADCIRLARLILPEYTSFDWSELEATDLSGRDVQLWGMDEQRARTAAAKLVKIAASVHVVNMRADPVKQTFKQVFDRFGHGDAVHDFIKARLQSVSPPPPKQVTRANGHAPKPVSAHVIWQSLGLDCTPQQIPYPTIANAARILSAHPEIKDRIWFDEFTGKIMQTVNGVESPWTDAEDLQVCIWLQQALKIPKLGLQTALNAIQHVAFERRRNPLTAWLSSLEWDGTERLALWLSDFLGAPDTEYTRAVGRNWLLSMVARACRPGCQVDHMPVLEGSMGRGKSSALAILGGRWYKAAPQAFGSKEFFEVIQGAWLIEIPDMVGFGRREHGQIISAITTRSDPYRSAYARHAVDHPRTCVFAATSEDDEYLKDSRGIRRYWPVRCRDINLEALAAARDQLFAEAMAAFTAGATWYEMPPDETRTEQHLRVSQHPWTDAVVAYAEMTSEFTSAQVLKNALDMPIREHNDADKITIFKILVAAGWEQSSTTRRGEKLRLWKRKLF